MKFKCERNVLLKVISIANSIATGSILSILSNVLLTVENDRLNIKVTDLKVGFDTNIPVEVITQGKICVYCNKLHEILKSLPDGTVIFEVKGKNLLIQAEFKKIDFKLKVSDYSDNFPELPDIVNEKYFEVLQNNFNDMIDNTAFAVSDDESRFFMNGVFLGKEDSSIVMIGTDGRRLSFIRKNVSEDTDIKNLIIPCRIFNIVQKIMEGDKLYIATTEKNLFIKIGEYRFYSNIIDGKFPDYHKVVPENQEYRIIVNSKELEEAVKRVSIMISKKSRRICLMISGNELTVTSDNADELGMAKEVIDCKYDGQDVKIILNYLYLLEPLKVIGDKEIYIEFTDPEKIISLKENPDNNSIHVMAAMQEK